MVIATKPGTTVPMKVLRNKQEKTLNVTVEELDLEAEQRVRGAPRAATISRPTSRRNRARRLRPDAAAT